MRHRNTFQSSLCGSVFEIRYNPNTVVGLTMRLYELKTRFSSSVSKSGPITTLSSLQKFAVFRKKKKNEVQIRIESATLFWVGVARNELWPLILCWAFEAMLHVLLIKGRRCRLARCICMHTYVYIYIYLYIYLRYACMQCAWYSCWRSPFFTMTALFEANEGTWKEISYDGWQNQIFCE